MQRSCLVKVKRMAHFDKGLCGRTVEAIEQPIAASASSLFGVLERLCEVRNIRALRGSQNSFTVFSRSSITVSITCDHTQLEANEQGRFCKNLGDRSC